MKKIIILGFTVFLISSILTAVPAQAAIPAIERAALIALYNSTNGDMGSYNSGWKTGTLHSDGFALPGTEDSWCGVHVNAGQTNVIKLHLYGNQLTGSIPSELGNLTNLQGLELYSNQLTGSIPPELGNLSNLEYLYLFFNRLTGSIPSELGNLTNLKNLYLWANQLTGIIPPELGNLSNLGYLALDSNQLTGSIPIVLMNLKNLQYLNICNNHLYTKNQDLRDFLNNLQPGWEGCQSPPFFRAMPWIPLLLLDD